MLLHVYQSYVYELHKGQLLERLKKVTSELQFLARIRWRIAFQVEGRVAML